MKPSREEIEKNKQDVAALNNDLKLLSTLLGRPISEKDIPQLKQSTGTQQNQPSIELKKSSTTERPKKTTPSNPALVREVELLQTILQKQPTTPKSTSDLFLPGVEPNEAYGKTNDALLATILKQRGIGPAHNNIPGDLFPTTTTTTTPRPRQQYPARSSRPILDGLTWLWRTWQDTAPGTRQQTPSSSRTRTRGLMPTDVTPAQSAQNDHSTFDDGLDSDTSSVRAHFLRHHTTVTSNRQTTKSCFFLYFYYR